MPSKKNQDQVKNVELYKSYDQFNVKERWSKQAIEKLFDLPFNDLLFQAHTIHRQNFDANTVQLSTLLSIKTGGCSEDCGYCPQSARYSTEIENTPILNIDEVIKSAQSAKVAGATRFCMGAAWRGPNKRTWI